MADQGPQAPTHIRDLHWYWQGFLRHVGLLRQGPVLVALLIAAIGGYYVGLDRGGGHVENLRGQLELKSERIAFLGDQLAAYKDRLQGASPDQAAKQLAELRERVTEQEELVRPTTFRKLTDGQKAKLNARKGDLIFGYPLAVYAGELGGSIEYAADFQAFFKTLDMTLVDQVIPVRCRKDDEGVMVGLVNTDKPSPQARIFFGILKEAGLDPSYTSWVMDGTDQMLDFDLFICQRKRSR